jgi:CRISPR-associated protein Csd1
MSWIQKLYETYELLPKNSIGRIEENASVPLLPICHTTNKAQIEIILDEKGNFRSANVINEATIIPCTEESSGRAGSKPTNHPLCDKLQYVAGDFLDYGGQVTSGFAKDPTEPFVNFCELLGAWTASESSHLKVAAIYAYVKKKRVIRDLIKAKVLYLGSDKMLLDKWEGGEPIPPIFKSVAAGSVPGDSFVRWRVELPNFRDSTTWSDKSLWKSWINYYKSTKDYKDVCFVTGKKEFIATQHPAKIRNAADKAKLISSNDGSGFTYRGRFMESEQVAGVGFEVTQEAHSALRWLISRQGYQDGDLAIVAWAVSQGGVEAPDPLADTFEFMGSDRTPESEVHDGVAYSGQDLALKLTKKTAGYRARLGPTDGFVIMGLDSATPGRMAITFYRELRGSEYLERVEHWHEACAWLQNFGKDKRFVGAPAPRDIAEACYGRRLDGKLRTATTQRLLPCIIDGQQIPLDIVESVTRRAINRASLEHWEWEKILGIACALYHKYHEERRYEMGLETERSTRDYLYGRLLAVADVLEGRALWRAGESRPTTAARLMQRFADHPCSTWKTIELSLTSYKARLGKSAEWYNRLIDEIETSFNADDFVNDKSLSGEFLLGYHCQRAKLQEYQNEKKQGDESGEDDPEIIG